MPRTTTSLSGSVPSPARLAKQSWRTAGSILAIGLSLWAVVFGTEIAAAYTVWVGSTAYTHCFLVLPVAAYLAWQRRDVLMATPPQALPWIASVAVPLALCWLVAERIGIMEGRQLIAMTLAQLLFFAVLGPRVWRIVATPLLYIYFLVPVGEFLVPVLQWITVEFIRIGLGLLRIPTFIDGVTIEIPEGSFYVAEACAGLRFLIASVAFGTFYACVMYRSVMRRLVFIAISVVVPIMANGVRALGIILIAHGVGNTEAMETDHVLYGWIFFSIVTLILSLAGLPFREAQSFEPRVERPPMGDYRGRASSVTAFLIIMFAAVPRLAAAYLDRSMLPEARLTELRFPETIGNCIYAGPTTATSSSAFVPADVFETTSSGGYRCGDEVVTVTLRRYSPRVGARPVFNALRPAPPDWELVGGRSITVGIGAAAENWSVSEFKRPGRYFVSASAVWVAGRPASGFRGRIRQAENTFRTSPISPTVLTIACAVETGMDNARRAVETFLANTSSLSSLVDASAVSSPINTGFR